MKIIAVYLKKEPGVLKLKFLSNLRSIEQNIPTLKDAYFVIIFSFKVSGYY